MNLAGIPARKTPLFLKIMETVGIYVARVVLTNARLGFGVILRNFYRGAKNCNFGHNFRQGSPMVAYYSTTRKNMENQKQRFINGYLAIFPQILWGLAEQSRINIGANREGYSGL